MAESKEGTSRRDFLKRCTGTAFALALAPAAAAADVASPAARAPVAGNSKVVIARDALLRGHGSAVDDSRMLGLLDRAVQSYFDADRPVDGWKRLLRPGERVGLKVNTIAGRRLSTNVVLVEAICERLQAAGIRAQDIVIWDHESDELTRAGFHLSSGANRVRCAGTDAAGYEQSAEAFGLVRSRLSKILTRDCDVLINVPVLKCHGMCGVTAALKNMYGAIDNPYSYHAHGCSPYIADLNMLSGIRTKLRLNICDATTASFASGAAFDPESAWNHNAIIMARDPVALDYTAWRIIEGKRAEMGLETLAAANKSPQFIGVAADAGHRLGTNDPNRITVVEV
ncbi:MAG: DUF362 domain-containing protein [Candidatus Korobacteraceae bacterium]|jgi:uncharacterized protein (DUF362 family)